MVKTVAIVGAGLAGLACAARLADENAKDLKVILLESSSRVGGRLEAPSGSGDEYESGARWIHGWHGNTMTRLAQALGLNIQRTDQSSALMVDLQSGRRLAGDQSPAEDAFEKGLSALFDKRVKHFQLDTSVAEILQQIRISAEGKCLEDDLVRTSIAESFPDWVPLSELWSNFIFRSVWPYTPWSTLQKRAMDWFFDEYLGLEAGVSLSVFSAKRVFTGYPQYLALRQGEAIISEGFSTLAEALLEWVQEQVTLDLRFDTRVTEITLGQSIDLTLEGGEQLGVDFCVVACPFWALPKIAPTPDSAFLQTLDSFGTAHLARCWVWFSDSLPLETQYLNIIGQDLNCQGIPCQWYQGGSNLLVGLVYGDGAEICEAQDDRAKLLRRLEPIFRKCGLPSPVFCRTSNRCQKGGSFSYPKVNGRTHTVLPHQSDPRVICAGEYAIAQPNFQAVLERALEDAQKTFARESVKALLKPDDGMQMPATTHGAFYSGLKAAEHILGLHGSVPKFP